MRPLKFTVCLLILVTIFSYKSQVTHSSNLTCTLTADKSVYKIGEVPNLKVEITNATDKPIYLIGALDGSCVKWRMPYCYFTVNKPKPDTPHLQLCGYINTIRIEDFELVKPSDKFNPYDSVDNYGFFKDYATIRTETFQNAGTYKIKFHYSTTSNDFNDYRGNSGSWKSDTSDTLKIKSLFEQVPKVDIVSNEIIIKFEE